MPANNQFLSNAARRIGSPTHLALVTPNDTEDLNEATQMVFVAVAGTLRVTTLGGETLTTPALNSGWHPMEVTRIHSTGTTATGIMVGW